MTGLPISDDSLKASISRSLESSQKGAHREVPGTPPPEILIEEAICDADGTYLLKEYKFFVFHGRVELICHGLDPNKKNPLGGPAFRNYLTRDWIKISYDPLIIVNCFNISQESPLPPDLSGAIKLAEQVAAASNKDFIRVDLFRTKTEWVFSECALRPGSMTSTITPFANQYMGYLWETRERDHRPFHPEDIRQSRWASLCEETQSRPLKVARNDS